MLLTDERCCTSTLTIQVEADKLLEFMSDPLKIGQWGFGSWGEIEDMGDGIYVGTSLFDGGKTSFRVNTYKKFRQVDYEVGYLGGELLPWIVARVNRGPIVGLGEDESLLTMMAWRHQEWSDEDWRLLSATHETEVFRIRYLAELEYGSKGKKE